MDVVHGVGGVLEGSRFKVLAVMVMVGVAVHPLPRLGKHRCKGSRVSRWGAVAAAGCAEQGGHCSTGRRPDPSAIQSSPIRACGDSQAQRGSSICTLVVLGKWSESERRATKRAKAGNWNY